MPKATVVIQGHPDPGARLELTPSNRTRSGLGKNVLAG